MRNTNCDRIEFTISGRKYVWGGGFGCILESCERGIKQGQTRVIGDTLFYAYNVCNGKYVSWTVMNVTSEFIREFKESLV